MKKGAIIGFLILAGACLIQVSAQELPRSTAEVSAYVSLAMRDAEHEHELMFTSTGDEADYWNDQRSFEQKLLEHNPALYRGYLQGKKISYLDHGKTCGSACGHGDFYYRQASLYLQYDSGDKGSILTLIQSHRAGVWEVSYASGKHHQR